MVSFLQLRLSLYCDPLWASQCNWQWTAMRTTNCACLVLIEHLAKLKCILLRSHETKLLQRNAKQAKTRQSPISQSHQKGLQTTGDRELRHGTETLWLRWRLRLRRRQRLVTESPNWSLKLLARLKPRNGYFFFYLFFYFGCELLPLFYAKFGTDSQRFETELRAKWPNGQNAIVELWNSKTGLQVCSGGGDNSKGNQHAF